jgi:hypothetical protein
MVFEKNLKKLEGFDFQKPHQVLMFWNLGRDKTLRIVLTQQDGIARLEFAKWNEAEGSYTVFKKSTLITDNAVRSIVNQFSNLEKDLICIQFNLLEVAG